MCCRLNTAVATSLQDCVALPQRLPASYGARLVEVVQETTR